MQTSYYANWRKFPKDAILVRISVGGPRFGVPGLRLMPLLYPDANMLHMDIDDYEPAYLGKLNKRKAEILKDIAALKAEAAGREILFLCHCKTFQNGGPVDRWCHRQLFADWYEQQTGEEIKELDGLPLDEIPEDAFAELEN